jgi:xylulokinase
MLECQNEKVNISDTIRFVGGGALSSITGQILADMTGHQIDIVATPQNVGAVGAAAVTGVGLGIIQDLDMIKEYIPVERSFKPNEKVKEVYDRNFKVFKNLYKSNRRNFKALHMKE